MGGAWFETVAEAQRRARKRLPSSVYGALIAGSEKGITVGDNVAAFGELGFAPHVAGLPPKRDLATTVMGQPVSLPVIMSPTGVQAVHPDGEVAVARAAAARGTAIGLSSFASMPVEEVVAANPQTFFQAYWIGTRDQMLARLERARAARVAGLIVTLDWSFSNGRDWGSPTIPERLDLRTMIRMAPEGLTRPRWLLDWARTRHLPGLTVPNMAGPGELAPTFFGAYGQWMGSPLPSWDDVRWLREQWGGPFLLKGVIRVDDARRAVDAGVTAISVSNHGGNNLDGTPATIRALPAVADAVGDQIEVLLDGGVRRGSDVVKALALGARAVMIGRAYLWGLAANGQVGVENVLDILRGGIDSALLGLGRSSVHDLTRDDVVIPPGFTRELGAGPGDRMTRVALVTGAARGIGAATVRGLAAEGWAVLAVDRCADDPALPYPLGSRAELDQVVREASVRAGPGGTAAALVVDVRDEEQLAAAVAAAERRWGGLDAAIAVAGVIAGGVPLWEMPADQQRAVLDTNLGGVLGLARAAIPALLRRPEPRSGRFLAVASAAATRGLAMLAAYCAAKAGVAGMIRALAAELGPTGITANAVSPGSTDTPILAESARLYGLPAAASFAAQQPVARLLEPDEVAAALIWLAGEGSSAITGAVIPADGGLAL